MARSFRWAVVASLLTSAACQCFVPVTDRPDSGGAGGGTAGGAGGGTGGGGGTVTTDGGFCNTPSDCVGDAGPVVGFCSGAPAVWSCAMHHCVSECGSGRVCDWDGGSRCTTCDGVTDCPSTQLCPTITNGVRIESGAGACAAYANTLLEAQSLSSSPCTYGLTWPDGGTFGLIVFYNINGISADVPALGGGCVGEQLPTGAIRFGLSCPACMLSVRPE
jgi:hypothetical protein